MSKVRTLARYYMAGHPKSGAPTFFVEKVLNSQKIDFTGSSYWNTLVELNKDKLQQGKLTEFDLWKLYKSLDASIDQPKGHTIRKGIHFVAGVDISLRIWSGIPYNSPQIKILPDLKVCSTWNFRKSEYGLFLGGPPIPEDTLTKVHNNDGLNLQDFNAWFNKPFSGQIICWDPNIQY